MGTGTRSRTHTCGELRREHEGQRVRLNGWVHRHRDKGGVVFVDLRDRYGLTQVTFDATEVPETVMQTAAKLRSEFVVAVEGVVAARPGEMQNAELATGAIELRAEALEILNASEVPPFGLDEHDSASEDLRLKYRYLDLRRPALQAILMRRHEVCQATRRYLNRESFAEIETPMLVRPTPEGARDYVVPSRIRPGSFYALPQSPQLYKQILMVAGFDRYYQIARCMRDEDLRADRQPEFSQIDLEMSFVQEEDVYALVEGLMAAIFSEAAGLELETPFPRLGYHDAMNTYGSDKPDIRFELHLADVTDAVRGTEFRAFAGAIEAGGVVKGLRVPAEHTLSRKALDELEATAKRYGAKGLARTKVAGDTLDSGIAKFLSLSEQRAILGACGASDGDTLLFVADAWSTACTALGAVRLDLGRAFHPPAPGDHRILWVNDFPLLERDPVTGALAPCHHIFTMPRADHIAMLDSEPDAVRAQLYDLVLDGVELGSGSIRIHERTLQEKILGLIGMDIEEAHRRFGFLLRAFDYGAPPHGGIALGLERIIMILSGSTSIRDTVAFPKTTSAASLMDGSPAPVDAAELHELRVRIELDDGPSSRSPNSGS